MRILLIQERGRHDANREFRESCCLRRSFLRIGHECDIWGLGHDNFVTKPDFNSYDLIVNLENYGDWMPSLAQHTKPFKVMWAIDAHVRGTEPYEALYRRGGYDILAHSTLDFVTKPHHRWLPNCTDHYLLTKKESIPKTHRIGFCGNFVTPERKQAIETLRQVFGLKQDIFVIGEDMVNAINSYTVHFNMNISNDINYRSFETLACGTVLITNYNPQYDRLGFVDGVNCFMYRSRDIGSIVSMVTKVLAMERSAIETVGQKGREFVVLRHTYDERAKEILNAFTK